MLTAYSRDAAARVLSICLLASLTACGGGGSATATSGGNSGGEPALPNPAYSGAQNQGTLDTSTAVGFEQEMFTGLNFIQNNGLTSLSDIVPKTYSETVAGSAGGSATLTGVVNQDGTGWLEETFSNYATTDNPGVVTNGTYTIHEPSTAGVTVGYTNYQVAVDGVTLLYSGTISRTGTSYTANFSIADGAEQIWLSNLSMSVDGSSNATVSGRVYDSSAGYVSMTTVQPGVIGGAYFSGQYPNIFPTGQGDFRIDGAGGTSLQVEPLDSYFVYLGLDADGDGKIDYGARIDRSTGELDAVQPPGTSVSALAELPNQVTASGPVSVDGRYSYTPGGFVSYSWQLLAAPPGSAAQLSGTEPVVQFTPDVAGDYLLQLTATAGGKSAVDVVPVNFTGSSPTSADPPATQYKTQSYIYAHAGQTVTLDARASTALNALAPNIQSTIWTLHTPAGSHASLADATATQTSFTPDVPGIYFAVLAENAPFQPTNTIPNSVSIIAVDEPIRFAPAAMVYDNIFITGMSTGGFSGSGDGLAFISDVAGTANGAIQWWKPAVNGLFGSGGSLSLATSESQVLLTADLNGDGIADFAVPSTSAVSGCPMEFEESGSGAYTASGVTLDASCSGTGISAVRSTVINGHPAVVVADPHYNSGSSFAVFLSNSGTMQAPVISAVKNGAIVEDFRLQDVNGDGIPDLLATTLYFSGSTGVVQLQVYLGDSSGDFTYSAAYPISGTSSTGGGLVLGDFNGDGKVDAAVAFGNTLNLFYGDGHGAFSSTPETRSIACGSHYIDSFDLNGDGHPDIVLGQGGCGTEPQGYGILPMYLSGSSTASGGTTSLGQEQFYPIFNTNENVTWPSVTYDGAHGDFNGDGLKDMMLADSGAMLYMPQLPAVTSATISAESAPTAEARPRPAGVGTVMTPQWRKAAAHTRVRIVSPER